MTADDVLPSRQGTTYLTAPSLACDLSWVLSVALRPAWRPRFPLAAAVFEGREDLVERIRAFWPEDLCFTEMQVLAHHAGALGETSPSALWSALEAAVSSVPTDIPLQSESPEERAIFLRRLEELKASPALRRAYLDLLRDVWEPIDESWRAALPMLEESGRQVVAQLEGGRALGELVGESCESFQAMVGDITERVASGQPLLVVPCLFFGKSLYLEFPGLTLIGSGFRRNDIEARLRTEALAKRLKTVADPTRLALLHVLAAHPSTVGDLAVSFGLSQPTVSMHMKSLRETGLVRSERQGGRVQLSADPDAVESLLSDLRQAVVQVSA
ncbi:MAG TPA: metalloregulator ArsR/SmtB family transcription factor [Acidimicrobiales bacterium]|nr:metalloregulator ArsR/SmtB family transcription factor [Acidimicrobiales bacterium]